MVQWSYLVILGGALFVSILLGNIFLFNIVLIAEAIIAYYWTFIDSQRN